MLKGIPTEIKIMANSTVLYGSKSQTIISKQLSWKNFDISDKNKRLH